MTEIERNAWMARLLRVIWPTREAGQMTAREAAELLTAAGLTLIRREPTDADLERVAAVYLMDDWEISSEAALARVRRNRDAEHFGDCTDVASSCLRCAVDDALKLARAAYRAALEGGE